MTTAGLMLHIKKKEKVKGTIGVVVAERLTPLMRQMDHTLASIHGCMATYEYTQRPRILKKRRKEKKRKTRPGAAWPAL